MRPVFNKKALYSDTTSNYVFPQEPTAYEEITIRFRTGRDNVDQAYMEWNGVSHLMTKVSHSEMFDFYEIQVQLENEPISYCFKVQSGKIIYYFDQRGAVMTPEADYLFTIIPGFSTPEWAKGAVFIMVMRRMMFWTENIIISVTILSKYQKNSGINTRHRWGFVNSMAEICREY